MSAIDMIPGADASSDIGERFVAMHTFESADDDDLTFQKGDIIIATDTQGDWWEGRLERDGTNGETGSFPHNYVARAPPPEGLSPSPAAASSGEKRLIAQHNYHDVQDGDLKFDKGDVLLGAELNGEWWTGTNPKTGESGDFPANYVKEEAAAAGPASKPLAASESKRLVALHNFNSNEDGDLAFKKGAILIGTRLDGDWWEGSHEASGKTGSFPKNYVTDAPVLAGSAAVAVAEVEGSNQKGASGKRRNDGETAASRKRREMAATRIQKIQRGRQARKRVKNMKTGSAKTARENYERNASELHKSEDEQYNRHHAATKIQAIHRGRAGRKKANRKRKEAERIRLGKEKRARAARAKSDSGGWNEAKEGRGELQKDEEEVKRTVAATKIQALQRGKKGRAVARKKRAEAERLRRARENKAATKIQAVQRGRMSRSRYGRQQKKGASDERAAEMQREEADWDDNRILPLKPEITRDDLASIFNRWDTDSDNVLTMEEIRVALKKQDEEVKKKADLQDTPPGAEASNILSLPRLQTARLHRHFEKNQEEHMNLDYHYWDLNEFIEMTQTPLTDSKWSSKKSNRKAQKRWAPKVVEFEDDEGNTRYKHAAGSKPLSKDAFIEMYHGTKEWDKAMVKISPSDAKKRQLRMKKQMKSQGVSSMLSVEKLNQIRLRLKQRCTTHRGIDVGNVMPRKRWPVDRDAEPDEDGNQPRLPVTYEKMKEAMKSASSSSTRMETDEEFAGFWEYLQTESDDFVTYEELTKFVEYKPRKAVRKRKSVDMSAAAQTSNFSSGFRPDNNDKTSGAFVSKSKMLESKDVNPVFLAFQRHVTEADWTDDLLHEHFNVFDKDGDGTITREEFRIGFESLGIPHKHSDLDVIVEVLDMNNDDVIDYPEFTTQLFKDPEQIFLDLRKHKRDRKKEQIEGAERKRANGQLIEGAIAPTVPEGKMMEREDLEQIRLRLRQQCTTHKGIEVAEAFPHRKWPGNGPLGHVSYAEMRVHMRKIFPNRLGADDKWTYPSFWTYLGTEDQNNCTKDEFTRFTTFQPADGKRYVRKKSIVMETSGQIAGFSNSFRPDINASETKSKEMAAKKVEKTRNSRSEEIKKELNANWVAAPRQKRAASESLVGNRGNDNSATGALKSSAGAKVTGGGGSIGANLKAAAFGKKIMNLKFARKFGDNKLDDDEVRLIKNKIRAASYKKGGADLAKLFAEWDKDKNEFLDYEELAVAVAKLLSKKTMLSKQEMMQLCKKFDVDGDGRVSVVEFKAFLSESEYKSRRKKRSEMEVKEFTSHASLVNSVTGMFRGTGAAATKLKSKAKKKKQPKKALWRQKKRSDSEEAAAASGGGDGSTSGGRNSRASAISNATEMSTATQVEGGGYDMMGRKIPVVVIPGKRSQASIDLANALKTIPQEKPPPLPDRSERDVRAGGNWFCDSDSAPSDDGDEGGTGQELMIGSGGSGGVRNNHGVNNAQANSEPRMTPIIKHRMRRRKKATASVMQYQSSWDEPVNKTGNVNPESEGSTMRSTKTSGRFPVKMTRTAERNSQWFNETDAGASSLMDAGRAPRSSGDIDMTLYRRKWNEQQPGDGSTNNPWRVGVKTSWTGEIAAPTWPTQKGTWVFVPNPPSREAKRGALPNPFGKKNHDEGEGGVIPRGAHGPESSPNQKHRGIIDTAPKVKPKVTYHAMERLNRGNNVGGNSAKSQPSSGHEQPWNSSLVLRVPDRPPAFDQNWPKRLEQSVDPDDEEEVARRRKKEHQAKLEARQLAPRQITRINSPRVR